jgi:hypothetical protein
MFLKLLCDLLANTSLTYPLRIGDETSKVSWVSANEYDSVNNLFMVTASSSAFPIKISVTAASIVSK